MTFRRAKGLRMLHCNCSLRRVLYRCVVMQECVVPVCLRTVKSCASIQVNLSNMGDWILRAGKQSRAEQRFVIKYFTAQDETPANIWVRLRRVHGTQTLSHSAVHNWYLRFKNDPNASCLDCPCCGGPAFAWSRRTIDKIRRLVNQDARMTVRELVRRARISVSSTHSILRKDLKLRKLAAYFVPKLLTDEQKVRRIDVAQANLALVTQQPLTLPQVITGDKSWCYSYEPNTKQHSQVWLGRDDQHPQKARHPHSQKRIMLVAFFDDQGCIHHEFVPQTVNRFVYTRILGHLKEKVRRSRPGMWAPGFGQRHSLLLHHDNASSHTTFYTRANLRESSICMLPQPPYSPDLAPADYFFFPRVKKVIRGCLFCDLPALKDAVSEAIRGIRPEEYRAAIQDLPRRWQCCVDHAGGYFEGLRQLRPENAQVANP